VVPAPQRASKGARQLPTKVTPLWVRDVQPWLPCGEALAGGAAGVTVCAQAESSVPLPSAPCGVAAPVRDRSLHQLGDLLLHRRAPLLQRERHGPQGPRRRGSQRPGTPVSSTGC